jgi:hypothetical protein
MNYASELELLLKASEEFFDAVVAEMNARTAEQSAQWAAMDRRHAAAKALLSAQSEAKRVLPAAA